MGKRVRTLLRVSSRQQLHDGDIPIQRAEAADYIARRPDWVFDGEYMEKAVSAYKNSVEEREVLQKILSDAEGKQFDVLLTYMSDRIGRQEEYSFYVAALNRLGIEVWTIKDGQLKTQEHVDKLLNYIRFWRNEGESKKTGMRVRDTQKEMVKAGKFVGGRAPFGYRLVPSGMVSNHGRLLKKLEIVAPQADTVRMIYRLAVREGMGYERIAKELNRQGIPTAAAAQWKAAAVRGILLNPVYMGYPAINRRVNRNGSVRLDRREWVYAEKQVAELVIVPKPVWEQAQEIREARKAKTAASREQAVRLYGEDRHVPFTTSGRLALTGLAFCGYCGRPLRNGSYCNRWTTKAGERKMSFTGRYICGGKCGGRSSYPQDYLENAVFGVAERFLERLGPLDMTEEWAERKKRQREAVEKEQKAMEREMVALRQDIRTLESEIPEALRGDSHFTVEKLSSLLGDKERMLVERREKAEENRKKLERMTDSGTAVKEAAVLSRDWKQEFREGDTAFKRMLLFLLLEKVTVRDGEICIRFRVRVPCVTGTV